MIAGGSVARSEGMMQVNRDAICSRTEKTPAPTQHGSGIRGCVAKIGWLRIIKLEEADVLSRHGCIREGPSV